MSNSELKKLISEHEKDKISYFVSPEKTRKPKRIELWESITIAELIRSMELVNLNDKEIICFLSKESLEWSNWQLSRATKGMSHTTINKYVKSALEKMQLLRDFLKKDRESKKVMREDEETTLTEETEEKEIEEMFEEYSHYESEKPDRRKKPKYHKDCHDTDKKSFQ